MENKAKITTNPVNNTAGKAAAPAKQSFCQCVSTKAKKTWCWVKARNMATVANTALLVLTVAMLVILIKVVQQNNRIVANVSPKAAELQVQRAAPRTVSAAKQASVPAPTSIARQERLAPARPKNVSFSDAPAAVSVNTQITVQPQQPARQTTRIVVNSAPRRAPSNAEWIRQEQQLRPVSRVKKLPAMSQVKGNLYIQNMNAYTIPCGTKVQGDLIVRNVRKLDFCGCFEVKGNVYVGRGVSFGPLPKGARIGGQIIH
ncbi:MAG: hypothetical protein FWD33_01505 [Alphaproteobacteria bacterium]|nr:hypothetical protein [Alphaproteobacteria bacterium]